MVRKPCLVAIAALAVGSAAWAGPAGSGRRDLFGTSGGGSRSGAAAEDARPQTDAPAVSARVWGTVELSDGARSEGWMWLTPGRGLVLFDTSAAKREEIDLHEIVELRASVRSEQLEREWRWREYGSDVKVETGRAYPRRWLNHTAALADGRRLECRLQGTVLYFEAESPAAPEREQAAGPATAAAARDKPAPVARRFILRQYERGETGQTLDDLVYVRAVIVHEKGKAPADAQAHAPVEPPRPAAPSPEASGDGGASRGADQ